ncbi:hypothetical protein CCP3SC1_530025 [Gammaproteobacteria bacterium]
MAEKRETTPSPWGKVRNELIDAMIKTKKFSQGSHSLSDNLRVPWILVFREIDNTPRLVYPEEIAKTPLRAGRAHPKEFVYLSYGYA